VINFHNQPLYVTPNGNVTLAPSSDLVTQFYINSTTLYAANIVDVPKAFISFGQTTLFCDASGPLVFSKTNSNKCAVSQPFSFDGNYLEFGQEGSFTLCGTGEKQYVSVESTHGSSLYLYIPEDCIQH
jgi:hypothetical protein